MRALLLTLALLVSTEPFAAAKTYQVTGPVLEVNGDVVVVQKGKDKWEVNMGDVKAEGGEVKVGAKVTITYTMSATAIEVKADKKK